MLDEMSKILTTLISFVISSKNQKYLFNALIALFFALFTPWLILELSNKYEIYQKILLNSFLPVIVISVALSLFKLVSWLSDNYFPSRSYEMESGQIDTDWISQGVLTLDETKKELTLTNSDAGCILRRKGWQNFSLEFECLIHNEHGFGLIYYAQNLGEYLMLKLNPNQQIAQHFRNNFGWEILTDQTNNSDGHGIGLMENNTLNKWLKIRFSINMRLATLVISGLKSQDSIEEKKYYYVVSSNYIINHHFRNAIDKIEILSNYYSQNWIVNKMEYKGGSIGFRAIGEEKVTIRKLKVII